MCAITIHSTSTRSLWMGRTKTTTTVAVTTTNWQRRFNGGTASAAVALTLLLYYDIERWEHNVAFLSNSSLTCAKPVAVTSVGVCSRRLYVLNLCQCNANNQVINAHECIQRWASLMRNCRRTRVKPISVVSWFLVFVFATHLWHWRNIVVNVNATVQWHNLLRWIHINEITRYTIRHIQ